MCHIQSRLTMIGRKMHPRPQDKSSLTSSCCSSRIVAIAAMNPLVHACHRCFISRITHLVDVNHDRMQSIHQDHLRSLWRTLSWSKEQRAPQTKNLEVTQIVEIEV